MKNSTITISAFSEDYSEKAYKFYFANGQFEFLPKSQVKFVEAEKTGEEFGNGIESRYFEVPAWLFGKLKGTKYYSVL